MAQFIMRKLNDLRNDGETTTFPHLLQTGVTTTNEVARMLQARTSFTTSDVKGLIDALAEIIADETAQGRAVRIDGLGTFKAKLDLVKGKEREVEGGTKRNAQSVRVSSVRFRADKKLVQRTDACAHLERTKEPASSATLEPLEARIERLNDFLTKNPFLRIADYVSFTHLSRSRARTELQSLCDQGFLTTQGRGTHKVYVKG